MSGWLGRQRRFGPAAVLSFAAVAAVLSLTHRVAWWLVLGTGAAVATMLVTWALWEIPRRQARRVTSEIPGVERFNLENEARRTLAQLLSGVGLIATLALTLYATNETRMAADRGSRLAEQSQSTQRFASAVAELSVDLGADKRGLPARIGGIYTLSRMAVAGEAEPASTAEILSAYIRAEAPAPQNLPTSKTDKSIGSIFSSCAFRVSRVRADVQAALNALSSINQAEPVVIDLTNTNLRGASLSQLHLRSARLADAILVDANLTGADLTDAYMLETDLDGSCLKNTELAGAQLQEASFDVTHLDGADLTNSCIRGSYLQYSMGSTPQQLLMACSDSDTGFPGSKDLVHTCKQDICAYS